MSTTDYQTALDAPADLDEEKLDSLWRDAYSSLVGSVSRLQSESEKLALEGDDISVRIHRALSPGDRLEWSRIQRMRGVEEAWDLFRDCIDALASHHSTARPGLVTKCGEFSTLIGGFEAREVAIRSTYQELAAVAAGLERLYPVATESAAA